jgi:hypothetical protein
VTRSFKFLFAIAALVVALAAPGVARADDSSDGWTWTENSASVDGWSWNEESAPAPAGWSWDGEDRAPAPDGWTWTE